MRGVTFMDERHLGDTRAYPATTDEDAIAQVALHDVAVWLAFTLPGTDLPDIDAYIYALGFMGRDIFNRATY